MFVLERRHRLLNCTHFTAVSGQKTIVQKDYNGREKRNEAMLQFMLQIVYRLCVRYRTDKLGLRRKHPSYIRYMRPMH